MTRPARALPLAALILLGATLPAAADNSRHYGGLPAKPHWLGAITATTYDGDTDDLLTAGLGRSGLALPLAIASIDPTNPAQLRRLAIHTNYRAIVDVSANGGYGTLYGPNVAADGAVTAGEGKIAGTEYIAYADDRDGGPNVTMMVQVPASFDPARPCIITGTSSGSRGVYGAIGSSGEWGLKRGCAVAYTDKGTGNGIHDLQANTVNLRNGVRADAATAGDDSNFTARISDLARQSFNADTPNRFAVKHAHSQRNPERNWGRDTLRAVEFAFYVLNQQFPVSAAQRGRKPQARIVPANTIVIASSVSNGGGAALAAAEEDRHGLIDGVAVSEPNIQVARGPDPVIRRGSTGYTGGSKPLYDYFTYASLYQPCAAQSARAAGSLFAVVLPAALAVNRCTSLAEAGLLSTTTLAAQADEALDKLLAYGWEPETILLHASHYALATTAITMTYANAHGRFSVADNLCGQSFAATDPATGAVLATTPAQLPWSFSLGNGVPPTLGINVVYNDSVGGAKRDLFAISPSTNRADLAFDAAVCQRELFTGRSAHAWRVRAGIAEVQAKARLNGTPAIIVHGRADTLVPVNFSSRPYVAENLRNERRSQLRYIEVTNAQHFDAFLSLPGYDTNFVPLHLYFNRALDLMWAHLTERQPLPPSQLVRTTPRGGTAGAAPALTAANVPPIQLAPAAADRITFSGNTLTIPD